MNKNLMMGVVAVIVAVAIGGGAWYMMSGKKDGTTAADSDTSNSVSGTVQSQDETGQSGAASVSVDSALTKLQNAGMSVGPDQGVIGAMVMASGSAKVDVDGKVVEIYSYDNASDQAKGLESLQSLAKSMEDASASGQMGDMDIATEIFEHGNLIVVVHSGDQAFVDSVKQAIRS